MPRKSTKTSRTRSSASKKRSAGGRTPAASKRSGSKSSKARRSAPKSSASASQSRRGRASGEIFQLLRADHRAVSDLFEEIEEMLEDEERDDEECLDLFRMVYRELTAHSRAEEAVVYARLVQHEETASTIHEARVEHALVAALLEQLAAAEEVDEMWEARLKVVSELVEHHVEEEEGELFPEAKKVIGKADLEGIAGEFVQAKEMVVAELGNGGAHLSSH
jgi:hemerythrin superfamily protein